MAERRASGGSGAGSSRSGSGSKGRKGAGKPAASGRGGAKSAAGRPTAGRGKAAGARKGTRSGASTGKGTGARKGTRAGAPKGKAAGARKGTRAGAPEGKAAGARKGTRSGSPKGAGAGRVGEKTVRKSTAGRREERFDPADGPVRGSVTRAGERVLREPVEPAAGRSGRRTRTSAAEVPEGAPRASLRVVRGERPAPARRATKAARTGKPTKAGRRAAAPAVGHRVRKRARGPQAVRDEILRLGGRRGERLHDQVGKAADAFAADRPRDAVRILRPVRDAIPASPSVRELLGLALYRSGRYREAEEELEQYVALTGEVDQHPVLMDCARARRDYRKVGRLWSELAEVSPSAALVTEGRIVAAGARADQGRLEDAIALLDRKAANAKPAREHHLRLWYALGDLEERAGNLPRARTLFDRVRSHDPGFADVAERLAALG